jgi:hypothetical protein
VQLWLRNGIEDRAARDPGAEKNLARNIND